MTITKNPADRFNNDLRYRGGAHEMQRQLTPSYVLKPVEVTLGGSIGLDPCTEPSNPTGAERFYTAKDDGLVRFWFDTNWFPSVFVNPPYGKAREPWVHSCMAAGDRGQIVVLLIPSHTDTRIWHEAVGSADALCFVRGRVKFGVLRENGRQEAASHPSALFGWNTGLTACTGLGTVIQLRPVSRTR